MKEYASVSVSVVTPAHNSARTIERCVHSVAAQTSLPLEHIIIDDGSVDATPELLERLSARYRHLKTIRQQNQGAAAARNAGIEISNGRIIAFLDSDDEWMPTKLEQQYRYMQEHMAPFTYGDYVIVDSNLDQRQGHFHTPPSISYSQLLKGCPIGCLTAAYDQDALGKIYMPNVKRGQDWGLWLAITRRGILARRYPGCLAAYHASSKNSLSKNKIAKIGDIYKIYRHEEKLGIATAAYYLMIHSVSAVTKRPTYG